MKQSRSVIHVLMNWVETPMYVRQDLADENHTTGIDSLGHRAPDCWQTEWDPDPDVCYGDTFAHGGAVRAQAGDLSLLRTRALSHTVLGTTLARPSGFFPACGFHAGAQANTGFYSTLTTEAGVFTNYATALWSWYLHPNLPVRMIEGTPPAAIPTGCP